MDITLKAMEYARQIFDGDSGGHDFEHTMRVYRTALRIAEAEGADRELVSLAALLHDVDDHKLSPDTCQELRRAKEFLHNFDLTGDRIRTILDIISKISFSAGQVPDTLEGKCVQDADRLDAMGAIGIARTFAYGGSKGRKMYDPQGVDSTTSVQHFYDKLLKLEGLMNTDTGRQLAHRRHAYMEEFLEQLYGEWEGRK